MTTWLAYVTITIIVLCGVHFVLERIVGPTLRLECLYSLFARRDELRRMIARPSDQEAVECLHDAINNAIAMLQWLDFSHVIRIKREMDRDEVLRSNIELRRRLVEQCDLVGFQAVRAEVDRSVSRALLANSLGLAVYVVPLIAFAIYHQRFLELVRVVRSTPVSIVTAWSAARPSESIPFAARGS